jgi:hypothetical protein
MTLPPLAATFAIAELLFAIMSLSRYCQTARKRKQE